MAYNILFFFTDQQRHDTCGCYDQPLPITPNLDWLSDEGVKFDHAFSPQPVCGPCRAIFQTGRYATDLGCYRNHIMLPHGVKTLANYIEEAGYETAYIGKWHLASQGTAGHSHSIDHTVTAIPLEYRGGYTGFWRAADVLEFTSHGYDGYVFDENNHRVDFKGYRADCITDFALEYLDHYTGEKPFFMTISHIEPHHQNDHQNHYEGPVGSKEKFADFVLPQDLKTLGGNASEEYPDYLGQCHSLDENLGRLIAKLKEKHLYEHTVIIYSSDHGSHFYTRNRDEHRNGGDDYKRTCHDSALHVPLIIAGGPFKGGVTVPELVSTESLPKTILALAGIDVGDAMIGENLLEIAEKTYPASRKNQVFAQISESRVGRCIRTPEFTYSVYAPGLHGKKFSKSDVYADDFLYDLKKDPFQLNNVVSDPAYDPAKISLREALLDWIKKAEGYRPEIVDD